MKQTTTDLWLASYVIMQGVTLDNYKKIGPRKVEFVFELTDEEWKKHKINYMNSDFNEFEKTMAKLRGLNY